MIRVYRQSDFEEVKSLLQNERNKEDVLKELSNATCFVYEEARIVGLIYFKKYDEAENHWDLYLYVAPNDRNKGIGKALYDKLMSEIKDIEISGIRVELDALNEEAISFSLNRGFKKYYGVYLFKYNGPIIDVNLSMTPFKDEFFDLFFEMDRQAFMEVRRESGITPYLIPDTKEYRDYYWSKSKNVRLLFDQEKLVGGIGLEENYIDNLFVSPHFQGKGYGKKLIQYGINEIIKQGYNEVCLYVLDDNKKALRLYQSVGFTSEAHICAYMKRDI